MDVVYINLDGAEDRRVLMDRQGQLRGVSLQRVRAVQPSDFVPGQYEHLSTAWERRLRPNEVAIFLSHLAVWRRAMDSADGLVVLEDDAILSPRFAQVIGDLPPGYELINLEDVGRTKFFRKGPAVERSGFRVSEVVRDKSGAGGYYLSPEGARKLVALAETRAGPSDAFMFAMARLRIGQVEPAVVKQVHFLNDRGLPVGLATESTSTPHNATRLPKDRSAQYVWRRVKSQGGFLLVHLRRLYDVRLRRVAFDLEEFRTILPIPGLNERV